MHWQEVSKFYKGVIEVSRWCAKLPCSWCHSKGLRDVTAEYEFFQFRTPTSTSDSTSKEAPSSTARFLKENPVNSLPPLTEGMFGYSLTRPVHNQDYYYQIYDTCANFGCAIEGWHTESGPGVFEAVGSTPVSMHDCLGD